MKKYILNCLFALALTGCNQPLQGTLNILSSPFPLKDTSKKIFELSPGLHSVEIEEKSSRGKLKISAKMSDLKGKSRKIEFYLPDVKSDSEIPEKFSIKSTESGQDFDLNGQIETILSESAPMEKEIGCAWVHRTSYVMLGRGLVPVDASYYSGIRRVKFHQEIRTHQVSADLSTPDTEKLLATLLANSVETSEITDNVLPCFSP
ncbi:MAG: hypothetical protein ABI041_02470 [Bdellovibrionia bacterium]